MATTEQTAVQVPPGGGEAVWLVGDTYTVKLSGAQTGGAFCLLEALVPPGSGPPPHTHHREDETFIVLEGELTFASDGPAVPAGAGTVWYVPKGTPHSFSNVGTATARMLFLYNPAGMEEMFGEIGTPAQPGADAPPLGPEDVAKLLSVAAKYGFEMPPPAGA